jgi:dolichol-phosphate mannosyltransferase
MVGISIIIPTRNEADNIDSLMQRLLRVTLPPDIEREIVFVDDSSTDATREKIRAWSDREAVRLICRDEDGCLASAVVAGAHAASHELVLVMDADLSHPPENIPDLLQPLLDGTHDMVLGSRYVEGGGTPQWPLARKIISRLAGLPARLFTAVNDPMAGFFAISRRRLAQTRPDVPGFKIGFELLATAEDDFRVCEVPIVFRDRFEGFSKMNKHIIFDYLKQLVQLAGADSPRSMTWHFGLTAGCGGALNWLLFALLLHFGISPATAHLAALTGAAASVMSGLTLLRAATNRAIVPMGRWLPAALVSLVWAIGMQGAVLELAVPRTPAGPLTAFLPAAVVGSICFVLPVLIACSAGFGRLSRRVRVRFGLIGAVSAVLLLRLAYLGLPELMEQEAYYWAYAQHPSLSYLDHPPLVALLVWLGTVLVGTTEFGVRIGAFICWFVTAFFVHRLTVRVCGRSAALGALLLVGILPFYFGIGLMMTPDAPLHAAWAALLYFLYRALVENRSEAWLGVGFSLGLGLLSKYTIVLLGPAACCFMLIDRRARRWFFRGEPLGALLLALVLFLPVLIWNYQHDWASFLFQSQQRLADKPFFSTDRLLGYIAVNLTPAGLVGLFLFWVRGGRLLAAVDEPETVLPDGRGTVRSRYLFLWLMITVPLAVFLFFSLTREVKLNWTSPLWLALLPLLGATVVGSTADCCRRLVSGLHRLWRYTTIVLVIIYAIGLHYVVLGLPLLPHPSRPFLSGWQEFARQIEEIVETVEAETGRRPLVVGMDPYQISSGLAFYRSKNAIGMPDISRSRGIEETAGWHLFTWDGLMYEYWTDPQEVVGRDILVVATSRIRVEFPYFRNRMAGMGAIHELPVTKDGQVLRTMYYRLLQGYRLEQ